MKKNIYLSIVIPTLNEEKNISEVIDGVKKVIDGYNYEIIVVDGHSSDNTTKIASSKGAIVIYDNIGKGSALKKGMNIAKGDIIISMDADLSNRPNELKLLITGIESGYDVCMGSRFIIGGGSEDMPALRKFGNKIFVMLVNLFYKSNYSDLCYGYRSFSREAIKKLNLKEKGFGIETEINIAAVKKGLKIIEIPSYEKKRSGGEGKLRTFQDGYNILKVIFKNIKK